MTDQEKGTKRTVTHDGSTVTSDSRLFFLRKEEPGEKRKRGGMSVSPRDSKGRGTRLQ